MDHTERLTLLAVSDAVHSEHLLSGHDHSGPLDPKTRALVRLAAVMAVGGPVPSYGAMSDSAIGAGASPAEMVDVLESIVPMIGLPGAAAAAHRLALALGYDAEGALDHGA
jgi:alkylhydroperoxidase/carboxymuconolactone decarboxylase family protein YurZ